MKRISFIVLALMVVSSCSVFNKGGVSQQSQFSGKPAVQTTFFGCSFGESYYSISQTLNKKFGSYQISNKRKEEITVYGASFGGITWDFVEFYFNTKGKCTSVQFETHYKDVTSADDTYNLLVKNLQKRYGYSNVLHLDIGYLYTDDIDNMVGIQKKYIPSKGGDYYWYVIINYYDGKLCNEEMKKSVSEM